MTLYLVTGGAGFIGSNLVEALLAAREEIRVLDNFLTGKPQNIKPFRSDIDFVEGDLRNSEDVARAVEGVQIVLHQAALPSVPRSVDDPATTMAINVTGTLNLLIAARDAGVRRVVFASSSSVYGDSPALPKHEEMVLQPKSPYAVSKATGEYIMQVFAELYDIETVCLRYFNVYGPRQDPMSQYAAVIPRFLDAIFAGKPVTIYGDGEQSRDFTYVEDVVAANFTAARAEGVSGMVFNVARGHRITLNHMLEIMGKIFGRPIAADYTEPRPGDVLHSQAAPELAAEHLNYHATIPMEEGIRRLAAWWETSRAASA